MTIVLRLSLNPTSTSPAGRPLDEDAIPYRHWYPLSRAVKQVRVARDMNRSHLTSLVILDDLWVNFVCKTPHFASRFGIHAVSTSKYVSHKGSAIFAYDCYAARMLANCCEIFADQDLALVFQVIVKDLQDLLSVAKCKSIATPVLGQRYVIRVDDILRT